MVHPYSNLYLAVLFIWTTSSSDSFLIKDSRDTNVNSWPNVPSFRILTYWGQLLQPSMAHRTKRKTEWKCWQIRHTDSGNPLRSRLVQVKDWQMDFVLRSVGSQMTRRISFIFENLFQLPLSFQNSDLIFEVPLEHLSTCGLDAK